MKLATFDAGQGPRTGAVVGDRILDLAEAAAAAGEPAIPRSPSPRCWT
ncbi:MAG TPA: hypothetical protein VFR34_08035 [Paracoccaceae bacterium]|nr:hypothetical protein [Paracoccaceae bacterium]